MHQLANQKERRTWNAAMLLLLLQICMGKGCAASTSDPTNNCAAPATYPPTLDLSL